MSTVEDHIKVIISLTSYPKRIGYVQQVLDTIYRQTMQPDEIVLWLAEEEFPRKEMELPRKLNDLVKAEKLTIYWCDNLKPHKKYFYAFQKYPYDLIITIDDDIEYPCDMVETLYNSYLKHPKAVSALRTHLMVYDKKDGLLPYRYWLMEYDGCVDRESLQLFCTGAGGILYPAKLFNAKMLDKTAIMDNCLNADDIWLKLMELANGIPIVLARRHQPLKYINGSQHDGLCNNNIIENDIQLQNSLRWFEKQFGVNPLESCLYNIPDRDNLLSFTEVSKRYSDRIEQLEKILEDVSKSPSLRIGKMITWPGRTLRNLIK